MTACRNKARGAVVAALAGALTLGAAPVMALADGASLMASESAAVSKAEVQYKGGEPADEFAYNGRPQAPVPVKVTPVNEDTERVSLNPYDGSSDTRKAGDFYYWYVEIDDDAAKDNMAGTGVQYANDKGTLVDLKGTYVMEGGRFVKPTEQGEYAVVVAQYIDGKNWRYVGVADTFEIVGQPLDAAVLCDGEDAADTEFNYDGKTGSTQVQEIEKRINVALDGRVLDPTDDYSLELWEVGATQSVKDVHGATYEISIGTKYVAKIEGKGDYEGQKIEREFTLGRLNLDDAVVLGNVLLKGSDALPTKDTEFKDAVASINGIEQAQLNPWGIGLADADYNEDETDPALYVEFVKDPGQSSTSGDNALGAYTFRLVASDDNPNVTGSCEFTVDYADYEAAISFGNEDFEDDDPYVVDLSADKVNYFDLDDIAVTYDGDKVVGSEGVKVTVTDAEGKEGDLTKPGTYTVLVDVDWESSDNKVVMGSAVAKVVVSYKVEQAEDVFLSYDGQNVDESVGCVKTYNGSDHAPHFSVVVKAGNKTLVEGTDYEVVFQKVQDDGKVVDVDTIVDAGYYNVVVRGITFSPDAVFDFEVAPIELVDDNVRVAHTYEEDGVPALAYTGDVIDASFERLVDDKDTPDTTDDVWEALPADLYEVEYTADEDGDGIAETVELKELGEYTAYLTTAEGVTNYDIDAEEQFLVTDTKVFADVSNDQWYSESVYEAARLQYMTGYAGTKLFGPADSISRADVVVTLYKMAGLYDWEEGAITPDYGYDLPYTDVDEFGYYAQALQWATKLGIVSGDGATGGQTFRPTDTVTREELAKMLYRYMELQGKTGEVNVDAVLGEYEDESSVSDWARTYVAWLVDQEVMGQNSGLEGNKAISRAEVAAMAVRLQPNGQLNDGDFLA